MRGRGVGRSRAGREYGGVGVDSLLSFTEALNVG